MSSDLNTLTNNSITKEHSFWSLVRFALPTISTMVFMSLYTMVDGFFVSRFVGTDALSAVNIVSPVYNLILAIGIMLATGGSAVIAKKLGENKQQEAKENFSMLIMVGGILGVIFMLIFAVFAEPILRALGANSALLPLAYSYSIVYAFFIPLEILELLFQYFFVTAGKPIFGLFLTLLGGCTNIVLDYIFIVPMGMGIAGAALATGIGLTIPAILGLCYFLWQKKGSLYLVKPKLDLQALKASCFNGSSEMVTNLAMALITFLYNIIMMRLLGSDGVAAITILLYAQFMLNAVFMGFSMGVSPVISYNYGAKNTKYIKKVFRYSLIFILTCCALSYTSALTLSPVLVGLFAPEGTAVYNIAIQGFAIFSINFLFMGINIFSSALFTAFSNGKVSAIISFLRTFVFITAGLLILPALLGVNGVWLAMVSAEFMAMLVCIGCLFAYRKIYKYA